MITEICPRTKTACTPRRKVHAQCASTKSLSGVPNSSLPGSSTRMTLQANASITSSVSRNYSRRRAGTGVGCESTPRIQATTDLVTPTCRLVHPSASKHNREQRTENRNKEVLAHLSRVRAIGFSPFGWSVRGGASVVGPPKRPSNAPGDRWQPIALPATQRPRSSFFAAGRRPIPQADSWRPRRLTFCRTRRPGSIRGGTTTIRANGIGSDRSERKTPPRFRSEARR